MNGLYTFGGLAFLLACWKGLYWLWKHSNMPIVKERDRQAMISVAKEIMEHKND